MNIDSELKRYYQSKRMDPALLERLSKTASAPTSSIWIRISKYAAVAFVLIAALWSFPGVRSTLSGPKPSGMAESIAKHVVFYHEEPMPLNVRTSSLSTLAHEMPRLGFTPAATSKVDSIHYQLYGARYCHIQGDLALHMRLTRDDGQSVTFYQVADKPEFAEVDGAIVEWNGYKVRIWRENGVLMCLAEKILTDV